MIGLCRYPGRVQLGGCVRGIRGGWQLVGFCKTEYAAMHGLDHFVDCHRRVIMLLHAEPHRKVSATIDDEGAYWPGYDEARLRAAIADSQRGIAALAGAFKDLSDTSSGPRIEAPIFAHPQFERLERQGGLRWVPASPSR